MVSVNLKDYSRYILLIIVLLLIYLSYKVIEPLLPALLGAIIFTILLHPVYLRINKKIKKKGLSSLIIIVLIVVFIIIPLIFFANTLFNQAINTFNSANNLELTSVSETLKEVTGLNINFERHIRENLEEVSKFFLLSSSKIIEFLAKGTISLLIMFFLIYLLLIRGTEIISKIKKLFPMKKEDKDKLFSEINSIIKGLFKGLFLIAILEGVIAWIGFSLFGVPNPIIWALVIALFAMIPVVGPLLVWPFAAIYLLINNQVTNGILLIIYSGILLTYVDTFLKPIFIGKRSKIDPVIILLGIVGGISLFGMVGIIVGPLILSILLVIYKIYEEKNIHISQKELLN
ncbi:MAG: AI-2E family transporter [Candidatus Woesearchaeota archaeon]